MVVPHGVARGVLPRRSATRTATHCCMLRNAADFAKKVMDSTALGPNGIWCAASKP